VLGDFAELWPERFTNVTNGVTPRRFLALSNPGLATLITEAIGERWIGDLEALRELERYADDAGFRQRFRQVKLDNKRALAAHVRDVIAVDVEPESMFDAQCKRIHEYKRQHLAVLHAVYLHQRIREGRLEGIALAPSCSRARPRPGYRTAKLMIRLIHGVAKEISKDPVARKLLRIVFVPDFNVKNAQRIYPAADLSEQISTAGKEASGTGNMKFALNGALTIGTLDGANVEIRDLVGDENFFLFGLTAEEVAALKAGGYRPEELLARDRELAELLQWLGGGDFSPKEPGLFEPVIRTLVETDPYCVLADFRSYVACQQIVDAERADLGAWTARAIRNVAGMAPFSSDRAIEEYATRIWRVPRVPIPVPRS
jgi:starch phosphorylase